MAACLLSTGKLGPCLRNVRCCSSRTVAGLAEIAAGYRRSIPGGCRVADSSQSSACTSPPRLLRRLCGALLGRLFLRGGSWDLARTAVRSSPRLSFTYAVGVEFEALHGRLQRPAQRCLAALAYDLRGSAASIVEHPQRDSAVEHTQSRSKGRPPSSSIEQRPTAMRFSRYSASATSFRMRPRL